MCFQCVELIRARTRVATTEDPERVADRNESAILREKNPGQNKDGLCRMRVRFDFHRI
jgi:hypothetical protein